LLSPCHFGIMSVFWRHADPFIGSFIPIVTAVLLTESQHLQRTPRKLKQAT